MPLSATVIVVGLQIRWPPGLAGTAVRLSYNKVGLPQSRPPRIHFDSNYMAFERVRTARRRVVPRGAGSGGIHPLTRGISAPELPSCLACGPSMAQQPKSTLGREMQQTIDARGDSTAGWVGGAEQVLRVATMSSVGCSRTQVPGTGQALEDCVLLLMSIPQLLLSQQNPSGNFSLQPRAAREVASSPASGPGSWLI